MSERKVVLPILGADGWVESSNKMADFIMSHFLATDYSQSYLFDTKISSFGSLIASYGHQPSELMNNVEQSLSTLFGRYFTNVVVECTNVSPEPESSKFVMGLYVEFRMNDGTVNNISKIAEIENSRFIKLHEVK